MLTINIKKLLHIIALFLITLNIQAGQNRHKKNFKKAFLQNHEPTTLQNSLPPQTLKSCLKLNFNKETSQKKSITFASIDPLKSCQRNEWTPEIKSALFYSKEKLQDIRWQALLDDKYLKAKRNRIEAGKILNKLRTPKEIEYLQKIRQQYKLTNGVNLSSNK